MTVKEALSGFVLLLLVGVFAFYLPETTIALSALIAAASLLNITAAAKTWAAAAEVNALAVANWYSYQETQYEEAKATAKKLDAEAKANAEEFKAALMGRMTAAHGEKGN